MGGRACEAGTTGSSLLPVSVTDPSLTSACFAGGRLKFVRRSHLLTALESAVVSEKAVVDARLDRLARAAGRQNQNRRAAMANTATPPTTPPAIAPAFDLDPDVTVSVVPLLGFVVLEDPPGLA